MAVVTVKSAQITNRDTVPIALQDAKLAGSGIRGGHAIAAITSGDDIASKYIMFSVPAKAIMRSMTISSPDIGTTVTTDVGLYRTTRNGGAVVDADFFTAAVDLHSGAIARTQVLNGNVISLSNMEKKIADQTGPASLTDNEYDVVLTLAAAADATATVFVEASWVEG